MSLGFTEILLIVCFVVLVFGAKRIPELARALGRASREFKKARDAVDREGEELTGENVGSGTKAEDKAESPTVSAAAANDQPVGKNVASSESSDAGGK